ncbi:toll-like receptor 13 [Trichogramma pretiosum]|uniref:toll-like receptor 13 n=1 Tax=Trichogramma pretiosum TaxID=7493 RepID=UPI0006C947A9|nr:toll-like receptor 13 [Trichogramma pretiosum]
MARADVLIVVACLCLWAFSAYDQVDAADATATAPSNSSSSSNTTAPQEQPLIKVCQVCNCTDDTVDCSNRKLQSNLQDHEWPTQVLKLVSFDNNEIKSLKAFPAAKVERLSLRGCGIGQIERASFKLLDGLSELDLSHNLLKYENFSPNSFEGNYSSNAYEPLAKLESLNLSSNLFHALHHDIFEHVNNLKRLDLSHNPFENFDSPNAGQSIAGLVHLEYLDISYCQLKTIKDAIFHSFRYLKTLNLAGNEFVDLPPALDDAPWIESLILDNNPFEVFKEDPVEPRKKFPVMRSLTSLSLKNMTNLKIIANGAMSNLQNLQVLVIEGCKNLTSIEEEAFALKSNESYVVWPKLKTLNISGNALRYLRSGLIARWDDVNELHALGNNWSCDCENQYFIGDLLAKEGKRLMGDEYGKLLCSEPPEHAGKSLESLGGRQLRCLDYYGARPEKDAMLLVGVLVGVLVAIPVCIVIYLFWRRGFFFVGSQSPASFSRAFYRRAPPYSEENHL